MAKKEKCPECAAGSPAWMATFSDLCTLLLCFFVLLVSMANFDPKKYAVTASSLQGAFGVLETFPSVPIAPYIIQPRMGGDERKRKASTEVVKKIKKKVKQNDMKDGVKVKVTDTGIAIRLSNPITFAVGKADLKSKAKPILSDIIKILDEFPDKEIRVEGHTDDTPIRTAEYESNWDLSADRALSIVKFFASTGVPPSKMSAVGYGEFRPLVPNKDAESRAMNRRIEIFVEYMDRRE